MLFLNSSPVSSKKVRDGVIAYKYASGTIIIGTQTYVFYSMTEAIARFRKKFPARR